MKSEKQSPEVLTSLKNPKVKNFIHLQRARERKKQNAFVVEGVKEVLRAITGGYRFTHIFFCPGIINPHDFIQIEEALHDGVQMFETSKEVYDHVVYRKNAEGITGWAIPRSHSLKDLMLRNDPLVLALESVEKPGNLGAILRTADAAGLDAVIVCDPQTDVYNPNVIRSSLGAVFTVPLGIATSEEAIQWLKKKRCRIYCTSPEASKNYTTVDFTGPSAIIMGTEADGLSDTWLKVSHQNIIIPMFGKVDSMNVSVSAGIVVFEALRQRN